MKNVFVTILQFVCFLFVFAAFSFVPPIHLQHVVGPTSYGTRVFIWDGLLISALLFLVVLAIEAARKRIHTSGVWTVVAFALAVVVGLAIKLGFKTVSSF
ncbi:MAG TPA: hypothetical protein VHU44_13665 [Acidobacteriaceae bacterium]|jgi:hypothetical protein|nr:hypothetical protein [Acidobacteriaceae bacterium]